MAEVLFKYPRNTDQPTLAIDTGANRISWAYNLNTHAFPTYGGEVVQILSTNIDVITIQGDLRSYSKMEEIYRWFLVYIQDATQGYKERQGYNEEPVEMSYPERGWTLKIQPISLPGLRYGTEVVVPQWQLQAHVIDPDPEMTELTISESIEGKATFRQITADIGFQIANPFSDPLGKLTHDQEVLFGKREDPKTTLEGIAKTLSDQANAYTKQEFKTIMEDFGIEDASQPATPTSNKDDKKPDKEKPGKNG